MDHQEEIKRLREAPTPPIRHLPAHIALRAAAWRSFSPGASKVLVENNEATKAEVEFDLWSLRHCSPVGPS